jgi:hypothetical protein
MSSLRRQRQRACEGKVRYGQARAKRVAHDMREKYQEVLLPYQCKFCGGWHVGHPPISTLKSYRRLFSNLAPRLPDGRQGRDARSDRERSYTE